MIRENVRTVLVAAILMTLIGAMLPATANALPLLPTAGAVAEAKTAPSEGVGFFTLLVQGLQSLWQKDGEVLETPPDGNGGNPPSGVGGGSTQDDSGNVPDPNGG